MAGATVANNQANFSSSGPYVNLPSGLFGSYTAVSVEAWVTTGVNTAWNRIFQFGATSSTDSIAVWRNANSNTFLLVWCGSAAVENGKVYTSMPFNSQMNLHVVVTMSSGDVGRLYINGVYKGSTPAVVTTIPSPTVFYVGKSFDGQPGLIGSVNEFRIWGGALSATDIATRYSQGPGEALNTFDFATYA